MVRNVSLTIEPGQKVALVGRTASGKNTLAKLLYGLYPPTRREILYDGVPLQGTHEEFTRRDGVLRRSDPEPVRS